MADKRSTRGLITIWLIPAVFLLLVAGSCGSRHGQSRMPASALPLAKTAATPPQGTANNPWDVTAQVVGASIQAQWRGRNIGDYDLDGAIGVADITPIAMNFGTAVEYVGGVPVESGNNEYLACIDGDASGTIGVSDITPIAQHFGEKCTGYRVYLGLRATGETEITWNTAFETPPGDPTSQISVPFEESRTVGEVQRYSFASAKPAGFEGFGKVRIVATDGTAEGALSESGEFQITGGSGDTAPPYNTGGITGLAAAAKPGRAILSWGTWEDAQSPPVDIEIAWGIPPLDPDTAGNKVTMDAALQTYEISGLTNEQAYEFACRFLDHATPPNATGWMTVSATPSGHLYSIPALGAEAIDVALSLSPSVDACMDATTPVHDQYAPMVAYISAGASASGALKFAHYNAGVWMTETVSNDSYTACVILTSGDIPLIAALKLTPQPQVVLWSSDSELSTWSEEVVYDGTAANLRMVRDPAGAPQPFILFTTMGASHRINAAYWDGAWTLSTYTLGFADTVLDLSLARQSAESTFQVLIAHGTVDVQQAQISSSIRCLTWAYPDAWAENGDYTIPNSPAGDTRAPFSTTFWPTASMNFLGASGVFRLHHITFPISADVPYGDVLGMAPGDFNSQPNWVVVKEGATGVNPLPPMSLTLDWYIEPRWTEGNNTIVFVNVAGSLYFTLSPFTITGGTLTPTWYTSTRSGSSWSSPQVLSIPTGRAHDMAPADTAAGFQMVYTQLDSMDVQSLLGGSIPTGGVYYARE